LAQRGGGHSGLQRSRTKHISILKHFAFRTAGQRTQASLEPLLRLDFVQGGLLFA